MRFIELKSMVEIRVSHDKWVVSTSTRIEGKIIKKTETIDDKWIMVQNSGPFGP